MKETDLWARVCADARDGWEAEKRQRAEEEEEEEDEL